MKAVRIAVALAAIPAIMPLAGCVATVPVERERVVVREPHPVVVERPVVVNRPPAVIVRP